MRFRFLWIFILSCVLAAGFVIPHAVGEGASSAVQEENGWDVSVFRNLRWRNIGPANMMGRVTDIEGVSGNPNLVYVGSASGGVWKTENGGITWTPIFDGQPVASIGDIALEPGNPEVIYVGTGEANVRNSVSFGRGVYKSTDGGKNWMFLGLEKTERISRIVVHPRNPQIVYVGALGKAFGKNPDRGVYRSGDGGKNWEKVLYIDAEHGVADMDINPVNPNIVFASMWRFERKPWTFVSGSTRGGVFRSIDGGLTWDRITEGLPKMAGRIGIKVAPSRPQIVYAVTESPEGTLYRSQDGGVRFEKVSQNVEVVSRGFYYSSLRIDPKDENRVYALASRLMLSIDGGRTFSRISPSTHVDFHALWIDPENPSRVWQGQDGGIAVSYDRGENWDYVNNFSVAQFYQIHADNREPFYYVSGGLQDNGTWVGPGRTREPAGVLKADWRMVSFGDGFHVISHQDNPDLFISESQGGNIMRTDMKTREQQNISPQPRRADGDPVSALPYRFNWNTPIIQSPHDKNTVYVGGNVVFKSQDFGNTWEIISSDLTTDDPDKQKTAGGPAWPENTTAEYHCTIISLSESPVQPGVLWAGTDDGNLQVTMNGGEDWKNVANNIPGLPGESPVSHVEPSVTSAGLAYCSFDRHMLDDFRPYIYRTTDFGRTWTDISGNLPGEAYIWVVREDPRDPKVIYAGTELGVFVSFSRGGDWIKLHMGNLPVVAVHDILIHPRDNDLIIGTHGRGIWILDKISFLQEMSPELVGAQPYIFAVDPAMRHTAKPTRYGTGDREYTGENPEYGALITYYLPDAVPESASLRLNILDEERKIIRTLHDIPGKKGLNRTAWNLRGEAPYGREDEAGGGSFFGGPLGPQVLPGRYTAHLVVEEKAFEKPVKVFIDPALNVTLEVLEIQHQYAVKLRDMQSMVNRGIEALAAIKEQIQDREKAVRAGNGRDPESAGQAIDENLEIIQRIQNVLTRPESVPFWSVGPRLIERLEGLFRSIDGVNAAPADAQIDYFNQLQNESKSAMARLNDYFSGAAVELNDILEQNDVPSVLIPEMIKF